jgi:ABC-type uncharacterized transport system auxiliary subunit
MKISNKQKGQTLIETALILFLLLLILLGIVELARAWFAKNSLRNGVRNGVRLAVVTPIAIGVTLTPCPQSPNPSNLIQYAICSSPGIDPQKTKYSLTIVKTSPNTKTQAEANDSIQIYAETTFEFIIGNKPWPWPKSQIFKDEVSMRYE